MQCNIYNPMLFNPIAQRTNDNSDKSPFICSFTWTMKKKIDLAFMLFAQTTHSSSVLLSFVGFVFFSNQLAVTNDFRYFYQKNSKINFFRLRFVFLICYFGVNFSFVGVKLFLDFNKKYDNEKYEGTFEILLSNQRTFISTNDLCFCGITWRATDWIVEYAKHSIMAFSHKRYDPTKSMCMCVFGWVCL